MLGRVIIVTTPNKIRAIDIRYTIIIVFHARGREEVLRGRRQRFLKVRQGSCSHISEEY